MEGNQRKRLEGLDACMLAKQTNARLGPKKAGAKPLSP
jgi:hypothetical protein